MKGRNPMKDLFTALASFLADIMEYLCHRIGAKIEDRDPVGIITYFILLFLYLAALTLFVLGLVLLIKYYWVYLVIPVTIVALIYYYAHQKNTSQTIPNEQSSRLEETIESVRARAENVCPFLKQTAFLLFTELCRYLTGLVPPLSLSAVTAPVNFDITASFITKFHFVIGKGQCDASTNTVKEILETLILQHLRARDLPISIPEIYTAADGSTWPGLVVDGVYDLGTQYRIDLVITNEAEVAALRAKKLGRTAEENNCFTPDDPDF